MKTLRVALYFFLDVVIASLGVAIIETSFYSVFPSPTTITGIYAKEFLMSAGIALILGVAIYWKLNRSSSLWVWTLGICLFVVRAGMGPGDAAVLDVLGIRLVCYSLGAAIGALIRGPRDNETNNRQGLTSLIWVLGIPPNLPGTTIQRLREGAAEIQPEEDVDLRQEGSRGGEHAQP